MKKLLLIASLIIIATTTGAQTTAIPDANFEQELIILGYDTGIPDGLVLTANIASITALVVQNRNISDLTGIQDFSSLTTLFCGGNNLTNLDVTQNTALTILKSCLRACPSTIGATTTRAPIPYSLTSSRTAAAFWSTSG